MKKTILTALVCLFIFSAAGCDIFGKKATAGDPVTDDRAEYEGAVMEYVSYKDGSLTVKIENKSDATWQSGNMKDYRLEVEKDGQWHTVEQIGEFANTMELMIFAPGEALTHTFSFTDRYGRLEAGKYRVAKSWWANATESREAGEFYLYCEFTVD